MLGLLKLMLKGISPTEEGILDKALIDTYALKGITMDIENPSEMEPPIMSDLENVLKRMRGGEELSDRLSKFTTGSYSGIFNNQTNIHFDVNFLVFQIRDLEEELRPIAMYTILDFIWNRIRSKLKKRILVIDEAWTMMKHEDSAKFLHGLVKRARKYYLGVTTITQDVEDFLHSDYGKAIITNSSMQLLLKQAPSAADILEKVFHLSKGEKYLLMNSKVGQGILFAGMEHAAVQIIASYSEEKIITTDPEAILKAQELEDEKMKIDPLD
jgi:type IV secretory pathway VirB4 component